LAASLSAPEERGGGRNNYEWTLSRDFVVQNLSGFIGDTLGWRAMFWIASGIMSRIIFIIKKQFPIISQSLMARTNN
jgi:hypothetical protein